MSKHRSDAEGFALLLLINSGKWSLQQPLLAVDQQGGAGGGAIAAMSARAKGGVGE